MAYNPNAPWLWPVLLSVFFGALNASALRWILYANRHPPKREIVDAPDPKPGAPRELDAGDILDWEFEYARTTASEAMTERHNVVNIYLLAAGVVISGVAAILSLDSDTEIPAEAGTALLWLLCFIGWIYFLAIVRLRQAWHDSAKTMNHIKDFYIYHTQHFDHKAMRAAFRWQTGSLPPPDKPWTVYFYSAMLIAVLNSGAYMAGGLLLAPGAPTAFGWGYGLLQLALGLLFFIYHVVLYFAFLKP